MSRRLVLVLAGLAAAVVVTGLAVVLIGRHQTSTDPLDADSVGLANLTVRAERVAVKRSATNVEVPVPGSSP